MSTTVCYICYRLPAEEHQERLGARAGQLRATLVRVTSAGDQCCAGYACTVIGSEGSQTSWLQEPKRTGMMLRST